MPISTRVRRAATAGLIFLAVRPIANDVIQGVDYRLIIINVAGAVAFCSHVVWMAAVVGQASRQAHRSDAGTIGS
jgi:hypothetical protein